MSFSRKVQRKMQRKGKKVAIALASTRESAASLRDQLDQLLWAGLINQVQHDKLLFNLSRQDVPGPK